MIINVSEHFLGERGMATLEYHYCVRPTCLPRAVYTFCPFRYALLKEPDTNHQNKHHSDAYISRSR